MRTAVALVLLTALLAAVLLVAAVVGPYRIAPLDVVSALFGHGPEAAETVLYRIRLPRILAAMLVGAALGAVAGILLGLPVALIQLPRQPPAGAAPHPGTGGGRPGHPAMDARTGAGFRAGRHRSTMGR